MLHALRFNHFCTSCDDLTSVSLAARGSKLLPQLPQSLAFLDTTAYCLARQLMGRSMSADFVAYDDQAKAPVH